jgi:secondary thiamine-phosphate synthase enzyme
VRVLKAHFKEITLSTTKRTELIDITETVSAFVVECNVESGICLVNSLHSTTAVVVNEHESGLIADVLSKVQAEFPQGAGWRHDRIDDNADAHLESLFLGHSKMLPIKDRQLVRGTWQNIFFLELDGPRNRRILIELLGV